MVAIEQLFRRAAEATALVASLPQYDTNGMSPLGTKNSPQLGHFLNPDGSPAEKSDKDCPWGDRTVKRSNPSRDIPETGITREYNFNVQYATFSPNGVQRPMIVINNQFPGPTIEANWGDWIKVTVQNSLNEGTSIHWHGLLQRETPWSDGVPGVEQCPIAPGSSFEYLFRADQYGTSWWHSHFSAQYTAGAVGAMIIHGPKEYTRSHDLGPVLLSDWYHSDYIELVKKNSGIGNLPGVNPNRPDANLINGKNNYNCSFAPPASKCVPNAGLSKFYFTHGRHHLLRLVNTGAQALQHFSVDDHELEVVSVDFVPIAPYKTKSVSLHIGQRAEVLVYADQNKTAAYYMRSIQDISTTSGCTGPVHNETAEALAVIYYNDTPADAVPASNPQPYEFSCAGEPIEKLRPLYRIEPPAQASTTFDMTIRPVVNATGSFVYNINNSTFRDNYNDPTLLAAKNGRTQWPQTYNLYDTNENETIRFVIINVGRVSHPMHMHGHDFYVLAEGKLDANKQVTWDGTIVNADSPARRDVQTIGALSYLVVQIDADNPGVWPFHCHIAWHVALGLYFQFIERRDDIVSNMQIPDKLQQTCVKWNEWTSTHSVFQIDSGLKLMKVKKRGELESSAKDSFRL
ncbi:MAG: hypothetical protein M1829_000446 [Trizodia sp. TS-e1964]|nr:MAG: hypothetical protein M1829_000446 [Trizodia sp. TS-e1964]